jgi:hypothetical protein
MAPAGLGDAEWSCSRPSRPGSPITERTALVKISRTARRLRNTIIFAAARGAATAAGSGLVGLILWRLAHH